jgi:hypothetical protein
MMPQFRSGTIVLGLAVGGVGCEDVSWESESLVDSLRVLGVKATPASLVPGEGTHLSILCADGRGGGTADPSCNVEVAWFGDCTNPRNNDPSECLSQYADWLKPMTSSLAEADMTSYKGRFAVSPEFGFTAPTDALAGNVTVAGHPVRYGTSYVYYAVCAGRLYPAQGKADALPVSCRDRDTGKPLDQRSFVVGITTIYTYDIIRNLNPEISSVSFDGTVVPRTPCVADADCNGIGECHGDHVCAPVVQPCKDDRSPGCDEHVLALEMTDESFYLQRFDGTTLDSVEKSLWATYYVNAGATSEEDFTFGLAPSGTSRNTQKSEVASWHAPSYPTNRARVWFVVRDDRGGQAWLVQPVIVR